MKEISLKVYKYCLVFCTIYFEYTEVWVDGGNIWPGTSVFPELPCNYSRNWIKDIFIIIHSETEDPTCALDAVRIGDGNIRSDPAELLRIHWSKNWILLKYNFEAEHIHTYNLWSRCSSNTRGPIPIKSENLLVLHRNHAEIKSKFTKKNISISKEDRKMFSHFEFVECFCIVCEPI